MIEIRELGTNELRAVEQLQKEIWQCSDLDVVPALEMIATCAVGALLIGAFDGAELVAFAYAFPGFEGEHRILHSDMLGVRASHRDRALGTALKLAQRDAALARGIDRITWTFDPLQPRNAYLNFEKLGVIGERYLPDFYGETSSPLISGGSDRLWVTWYLGDDKPVHQASPERVPMTTRLETRAAFQRAFATGLIVVGFDRQRLEYELAVPASRP